MTNVRYSVRAEADLDDVAEYSRRKWGAEQMEAYLDDLQICCQRLANFPMLGRAAKEAGAGIRRVEQGKHVVFYKDDECGIVILRILHQQMTLSQRKFSEQ